MNTIDEKIGICKEYISKSNILGGCNFVFGIDLNNNNKDYGKIALTHTKIKEFKCLKIPDFVECIGLDEEQANVYSDNYISISSELVGKNKFYKNANNKKYEYAFNFCNIDKLIIGESVEIIHSTTFIHNYINSIVINKKLKEIREEAFDYCKKLKSINIENMQEGAIIGDRAFSNCKELKSVDLSRASSIGSRAFYSCIELEDVKLPLDKSMKIIPAEAFCHCTKLKEIIIPDSIEIIGDNAFLNNYSLKKITIGKNVTEVRKRAFGYVASSQLLESDKLEKNREYIVKSENISTDSLEYSGSIKFIK